MLRRQPSVIPPPARFKIDPYYTKFTYAREFPVLGSNKVSDEALLKANDTIRKMFAYRHDILKALIADGARLVVLGRDEALERAAGIPGIEDDARASISVRYLDYTPSLKLMVVPEENVLGLADEPLRGKGHGGERVCPGDLPGDRPASRRPRLRQAAAETAIRAAGEAPGLTFDQKLQKLYDEAKGKGRWRGTAAARDRDEYWVAGVEAYFDAAGAGPAADRRRPAHQHPRGAESLRPGSPRAGPRDDGLSGPRRLAVQTVTYLT